MFKLNQSRLTVTVLAVVAIVLVMGGAAVASNMGFKFNKVWTFAGLGQIGDNWTTLPHNNPYVSVGSFCTQVGLVSTGVVGQPRAIITIVRAVDGLASSFTCGSAAANAQPLPTSIPNDPRGIRVRQPNVTGALTNGLIVGSHNPALRFTIEDAGGGTAGDNWLGVPYHTTAVSFADLCSGLGLTSTGAVGSPRAQVTRVNAANGIASSATCGSAAAGTSLLVLGEAVRVREPFGPLTGKFVPHF